MSGFDTDLTHRNFKLAVMALLLYLLPWFAGLHSKLVLAIHLVCSWYLCTVILSNYQGPFAIETLWICLLMQLVDAMHLCVYLFINNSLWVRGAWLWSNFPKLVWMVALQILIKGSNIRMLCCVVVSSVTSYTHITSVKRVLSGCHQDKSELTVL